jgi:methylated-DNA-protein-cysteine methyltransferase related protein
MSEFKDRVIAVVQKVPYGKVVSYGQVAAYVGAPRAARQVGWILRGIDNEVSFPWWRVVNNAGKISIKGNFNADKSLQRKLLESEGIVVLENFTLDIAHYRFMPTDAQLKQFGLNEDYLQRLKEKYFTSES